METQKYYDLVKKLCDLCDSVGYEIDEPTKDGNHVTKYIFSPKQLCNTAVTEKDLEESFNAFKDQLNNNLLNEKIEIVETEYRSIFGCFSDGILVFGLDMKRTEACLTVFKYYNNNFFKRVYSLAFRYADFLKGLFDNGLKTYKEELLQHQEMHQEMHQETKEKKKRRKLKDCIIASNEEEKEERFKTLCNVMNGKRGKDAVLPIFLYVENGRMTRPAHSVIIKQFGKIFAPSFYSTYMDKQKYSDIEIEGMKNALDI